MQPVLLLSALCPALLWPLHQIATGKSAKGRSPLLGVLYDELARQVVLDVRHICTLVSSLAGSIGRASLEKGVTPSMLRP